MSAPSSLYHRHRFPPEIISYAVYMYYRFTVSDRDVEEMLARRGIVVSYETIRRWCLKFGPLCWPPQQHPAYPNHSDEDG